MCHIDAFLVGHLYLILQAQFVGCVGVARAAGQIKRVVTVGAYQGGPRFVQMR
jgi:hypothetical protein